MWDFRAPGAACEAGDMIAKEGQWAGGGWRAEGESQAARNPEVGMTGMA